MGVTQVAWPTDSLGAGTIFGHATFQGGRSRSAEVVANHLASIPGMGQVLSPGDRLVGSTALDPFATSEAAYSGSGWNLVKSLSGVTATHGGTTTAFTSSAHGLANGTPVIVAGLSNTLGGAISNGTTYYVVNTAANTFGLASTVGGAALALGGSSNDTTVLVGMPHDKIPYGLGKWGTTVTDIVQFNNVYGVPLPCFELLLIDIAGGGDLSYSLDGGSTWLACGQSMSGNNGIVRFKITPGSPIAAGANVQVRCGNASNANVVGLPFGWRPFYIDPATVSTGVIVNDYGSDGQTLHNFMLTMTGGLDHAAILDSVRLGTGSPLTGTPNITMMLHLNDDNYPTTASGTSFSTDVASFKTRAHPLGPILLIGWCEADPTFFDATVQATMRSTLAAAADSSTYYLDLNAAYANMGYSGNAAISAGGWLQDKIHPSGKGEFDVGDRIFSALRNGPLSTTFGGNVNGFTLGKSLLGGTDVFGGRGPFLVSGTGAAVVGGGVLAATGTKVVNGHAAAIVGGGTLVATGTKVVHGVGIASGGGTLTAVGKDVIPGVGAIIGGGALAATGTKVVHGSGAVIGDSGAPLHATGVKTVNGTGAAVVGGGTLVATGNDIIPGAGAIVGGGVLAATGTRIVNGSGASSVGGALAATGTTIVNGHTGVVGGGGILTATGTRVVEGAAAIVGGGVLAATGVGVSPGSGAGSINGGGVLAATGTVTAHGTGAVVVGGVLQANGTRGVNGSGVVIGGGVFAGTGRRTTFGAGVSNLGGVLHATGTGVIPGTGIVAGDAVLTATGTKVVHGVGATNVGGTLAANAHKTVHGSGVVSAGGVLAATGFVGRLPVTGSGIVTGGGVLQATGTRTVEGSGSVIGGGTLYAFTGTRNVKDTRPRISSDTRTSLSSPRVQKPPTMRPIPDRSTSSL